MRTHWKYRTISHIVPLAIVSAVGCGSNGVSSEMTGDTTEAVAASGITASIVINSKNSTTYQATVTVKNGSAESASGA
jgi:hypothetical protein